MTSTINIEIIYPKVRTIVHKLRRKSYVKLWDESDWDQEGLITLYLLLEKHKELVDDDRLLCCYFKTKFSNYVNDVIRKQESQKRRFDRMPYEEIGEIAHAVSQSQWDSSEQVAFDDCYEKLLQRLTLSEKAHLEQVMRGERFKGKKRFVKQLTVAFKGYESCSLS